MTGVLHVLYHFNVVVGDYVVIGAFGTKGEADAMQASLGSSEKMADGGFVITERTFDELKAEITKEARGTLLSQISEGIAKSIATAFERKPSLRPNY